MGFGAVGWIALGIFAPSVLLILTPFLQGIAQGIVEFIKVMYAGIVNILNSWQSTVAVVIIALLAMSYGTFKEHERNQEEVAPLVQQEEPAAAPSDARRTRPAPKKIAVPSIPSIPSIALPRSSNPTECHTCDGAR